MRATVRKATARRVVPCASGEIIRRTFLALVILLTAAPAASPEGIDRWRTPDGRLHFGDDPPPGSEKLGESEWQGDGSRNRAAQDESTRSGRSSFSQPSDAITHVGRVVGVTDGDTITVLAGGLEMRVRLAQIDAPERGQPWGSRAKQALSNLVFGKEVRVVQTDVDHYGRVVGRVYAGGQDVNAEMVRGGHAWVYRRYATDQSLHALEDEARESSRGLWALPEAQRTSPSEWRRESTSPRAPPRARARRRPARYHGPVVGNRRSMIYHWPACPSYDDISPRNRVPFGSRSEAESAGYREAGNCP